MSKSTVRSQQVLKEIRRRFLSFRRTHGGKRSGYPKAIKELALAGLEQGYTDSEVAQAAGVSGESIRNWRQSMRETRPVVEHARPMELKLIQSRKELPIPLRDPSLASTTPEAMAHIEFRSGARMTVPVSAISEQLINFLIRSAP